MTAAARGRAFRQKVLLAFLLLLALADTRQLLISPSHGQDFRDFFAAATLVAHGQDPYDSSALAAEQDRLYNQPDHLRPGDRAYYDALPYPQGPWVALALTPLTPLPWPLAYLVSSLLAFLALGAAAWGLLRLSGWRGRAVWLAVGAVLCSPVAFINFFQGQPVPWLLLALATAWWLTRAGRPQLAGAIMAVAWIKPHLGLPLLIVLLLLGEGPARRVLLGFGAGSVAAFALAAIVLHGALLEWPGVVLGQWSGALQQADMASVNAFYYPALHNVLRQAALGLVLLAAAGYLARAFTRCPAPRTRALTVLLLTVLAAPYAHSYDSLLLLPVLVVLLGPTLQGWRDAGVELALWAFVTLPLLYFAGFHVGYLNGFTAIPVVLLGLAWHRQVIARPPARLEAAA
ncbi:MAG TPA: glycosyltransferase family 87 protein [Candidatus Dormibacteraeota bacterium]